MMAVTSLVSVRTVLLVSTGATKGKSLRDKTNRLEAYALTIHDSKIALVLNTV